MIRKSLTRWVLGSTFLVSLMVPAVAFAQETTTEASGEAWQAVAAKAIAAGLAMGLSAIGAGYAQAKIGSAGAGTLAERPEVSIWIITLQALPEVIVLLGFVSAILISG
jgi:V/A-type H+/Na+-transporting ATPase subunit K